MKLEKTWSVERPMHRMHAVRSANGGNAGSFQREFEDQMREDRKNRAAALFDRLTQEADEILEHAELSKFETYRRLIGELMGEVVQNAYRLQSERVTDFLGRERFYATIRVVDEKLKEMADEILRRNTGRLLFLSRIDEIRVWLWICFTEKGLNQSKRKTVYTGVPPRGRQLRFGKRTAETGACRFCGF
jgi:uncharacterized protein YaaR (DUF327 family)